jgi:hypothetical protein
VAQPVSQEKRIELFAAYCERQTIQHVARTCSVSPTTALRYKRLDRWDERLRGVSRKAEDKIDESIAEMRARQAKQARAVQAKALQKVIEDGFRNTRDAADAYFKAVQEERVVRGEPSDRFNVVQEQMAESRQDYEMLKELLKDEDFRMLSGKVLEARTRLLERGGGT